MTSRFEEYFREWMGAREAELFFEAIEKKDLRRSLRVNTLKTSKSDLKRWLKAKGYLVKDSPFSEDGLEIEGRGMEGALKLPYDAGYTYPQDPSSMFAVELLDPKPGEWAIDLTAAPGGKATHMAQKMQNRGVLVANDHDLKRLKALKYNLERLGIWNTVVTRLTPHKLSLMYTEAFDRVLLDPSCSGEGLLVTPEGKGVHWSLKGLKRYSAEQFGLLCSAFRLLKPGGRLVYSTCTLNPVEDDGVVQKLLNKFPEAEILDSHIKGAPEQIGEMMGIRFWPQKTRTKGFFCIAIGKKQSVEFAKSESASRKIHVLSERRALPYLKFFKTKHGIDLKGAVLAQEDKSIYRISPELKHFMLPTHGVLSFPLLSEGVPSKTLLEPALLL